jgi:hypothetical protein
MKTAAVVVGVLLVLSGAVWFLQGIDVLHGSSMSGETTWAVIGPITALVGVLLIRFGWRKRDVRADQAP